MELINFICNDTKGPAGFMKELGHGVSNIKALESLPPDVANSIPTSPSLEGKVLFFDDEWWGKNLTQVSEQFEAFKADWGS